MNIIMAIIFGLKRAPECIKMHHFEGEQAKISLPPQTPPPLGYPFPRPNPVGPSAPPFEYSSTRPHRVIETTFLDTGLFSTGSRIYGSLLHKIFTIRLVVSVSMPPISVSHICNTKRSCHAQTDHRTPLNHSCVVSQPVVMVTSLFNEKTKVEPS